MSVTGEEVAVPYAEATIGDLAYTWENDHGDWGDYVFETVDPFETGAADGCAKVIRKTWRLVAVDEVPATEEQADG